MGTLRDANPEYAEINGRKVMFFSAFFGFSDWPKDGFILIDDINEIVLTRNQEQGFGERYTFDEWLNRGSKL